MASPNIPRYVYTGPWPARKISDLLTAPNLENATAHQRYLEINGEREMVHHQLTAILKGRVSVARSGQKWTSEFELHP